MPFSAAKYMKFRNGMHKRIGSLRSKTEDSMEVAVDTMMEERVTATSGLSRAWTRSSSLCCR